MASSTVYFATNRKPVGDTTSVGGYGPDIQPPSDSRGLIYGTAFVDQLDVPTNMQGVVCSIQNVTVGEFSAGDADDLQNAGRSILVFVHGFDNSFSDALTRCAFNREWLAASGAVTADMAAIAFSWPSSGQVISGPIVQSDYLHDQGMARLSGLHFMTFLASLEPILTKARANGHKTYLLAHSMGHLALQFGVENWFVHGNGPANLFDVAFLAAGDCTYDALNKPAPLELSCLTQLCGRVVTYYSHVDHVLQLSAFVNAGAQRLGQDGPENRSDLTVYPQANHTMVDATSFQDYDFNFLTSHQYYRQSPIARADIVSRL